MQRGRPFRAPALPAWTDGEPAVSVAEAAGMGGYPATKKLKKAVARVAKLWADERHGGDTLRVTGADIDGLLGDGDTTRAPAERRALSAAVARAERDRIEAETGRVLLPSHLWPMFIDSASRDAYPRNADRTFKCRHNGEDTIFLKRIHQGAVDLGWGDGVEVGEGRRVYARGGVWVEDFFPFFLDLLGGQPDDGTLARSIHDALTTYCSIESAPPRRRRRR